MEICLLLGMQEAVIYDELLGEKVAVRIGMHDAASCMPALVFEPLE